GEDEALHGEARVLPEAVAEPEQALEAQPAQAVRAAALDVAEVPAELWPTLPMLPPRVTRICSVVMR
uniref:hypothetical protein n=1 Tax=Klebsiella michiganensis TaxID=1134687 RepID=UPI001954C568